MDAANILLAIGTLVRLTTQTQRIALLIQQARDEGRDITEEELNTLAAEDDAAKAALDQAIAAARGQ